MQNYRIANLTVGFEPKFKRLRSYAEKYRTDLEKTDFTLEYPDGFFEERQKENPHLDTATCEYIWMGAAFAYKLLDFEGFVLHSSAFSFDGKAYLFSADSGVGKSTQNELWRTYLGKEKTTVINDDKPAIRLIDGKFHVCGTPFSGKSDQSANIAVPLEAIMFIHRSEKPEISIMDPSEAVEKIATQTLRPHQEQAAIQLLDTLDKLLSNIKVYSFGCNMLEESAKLGYEYISKNKS